VSDYWDPSATECLPPTIALFIHGVTNTITDIYVYVLPMRMVWNTQLPKGKRIGLLLIFAVGFLYVFHFKPPPPFSQAQKQNHVVRLGHNQAVGSNNKYNNHNTDIATGSASLVRCVYTTQSSTKDPATLPGKVSTSGPGNPLK
jgi:hypothetical protein